MGGQLECFYCFGLSLFVPFPVSGVLHLLAGGRRRNGVSDTKGGGMWSGVLSAWWWCIVLRMGAVAVCVMGATLGVAADLPICVYLAGGVGREGPPPCTTMTHVSSETTRGVARAATEY